eukprot:357527-Chlamydomonas_euryale.AAC.1
MGQPSMHETAWHAQDSPACMGQPGIHGAARHAWMEGARLDACVWMGGQTCSSARMKVVHAKGDASIVPSSTLRRQVVNA